MKMDRITGMGDKINSLEEQKAFCLMSEKFDEAARLKDELNGLRKVQIALLDEHIKHDNKLVGLKRANAKKGDDESVQFGADGDYYNDNETPRFIS